MPTASTFRTAAITLAVTLASFCTLYAVSAWAGAGPGAAILAVVMSLSLARRRSRKPGRSSALELLDSLVVVIGAAGVAWLMHAHLFIGAVVFTAGLVLSVWLRRFGGNLRSLGGILALPFVAALVAPGAPHSPQGAGADLLLVLAAALAAYAWDWLLHSLARVAGLEEEETAEAAPASEARPAESKRLDASTRMAAQMGVALAAAFVLGILLFPRHWSWVVLTAFIVCSGSIGRGDAVYKGVLRLAGAFLGAIAAAALQYVYLPQGPAEAALIFGALFVGLWLRDANYAWWAASITLVVALLNPYGEASLVFLGERLLAILIGAICGVAACWFVLPITSRSVVRRRIADALAALEGFAGAAGPERADKLRALERCAEECERVAAPLRWHRRLAGGDEHPAEWLELVQRSAAKASSVAAPDAELVKAVRLSRRALKEDQGLTPALQKVATLLQA